MESVMDLGTRGHYSRCWDGSVGPATLRGEEGPLKGQKPSGGRIWGPAVWDWIVLKAERGTPRARGVVTSQPQGWFLREEGPLPWFT